MVTFIPWFCFVALADGFVSVAFGVGCDAVCGVCCRYIGSCVRCLFVMVTYYFVV